MVLLNAQFLDLNPAFPASRYNDSVPEGVGRSIPIPSAPGVYKSLHRAMTLPVVQGLTQSSGKSLLVLSALVFLLALL